MPDSDPGLWVSLDGVEGTGKSTLGQLLHDTEGIRVVPEFSGSAVGSALRELVVSSPHYVSSSEIGQSLSFLGDFFELVETFVIPARAAGLTVVSDRGWLSKYAYQLVVLEGGLGTARATTLLDSVLSLMPTPDVTIYLTASRPELFRRLSARDGSCSPERLAFMERADAVSRHLLGTGRLPNSLIVPTDGEVGPVLDLVLRAIHGWTSAP